jgi:hypothetical protein
MELVRYVQNELQGLFVGAVHPAFPRRPENLARKLAQDRRLAIDHFLGSRKAPDLRRDVRFSPGDVKSVRKHVDERTVEEDGPPELVTAFLERPPASTISLERRAALEEGAEEAVGQYVRLMHERQQLRDDRHWWLRLWGEDRYEDLIVPLLARVVDAAVLADRFIDEQRRDTQWNALPFYDRIWAEYRPIPFPLSCLLRPVFGNGLPIRVVIETKYSDVFLRAMFGGALRRAVVHANWFGIGIQIERPDQPQDFFSRFVRRYFGDRPPFRRARWPWAGAQWTQQCRRLKAHTLGVLSPQIDVTFKTPRHRLRPDPTPANWSSSPTSDLVRRDAIRLLPTTCLADGCPSLVRPRPFALAPSETASTSPVLASRTMLARRGSVSNAPAVSLMPSEGFRLFPDCRGVCLQSMPRGIQTVEIERDTVTYTDDEYVSGVRPGNVSPDIGGDVHQMIPLLPRRYWGPSGELLHRRVWIGAFYDSELRVANRFPLFGCKFTYGDYSRMSGTMKDLGGGVAKPVHAPLWLRFGAPDPNWRPFGGLFVSTQGPRFAANLLLPEPLLCDYLKHLSQHEAVVAATRLATDDELPFVPLPEDLDRKAR